MGRIWKFLLPLALINILSAALWLTTMWRFESNGVPRERMAVEGSRGIAIGDRFLPTDQAGRQLINYYGPDGTIPTYSLLDLLRARKARAVELSLLGERLPAEKALEWGLVNRVVDDAALAEETKKLAHDLANGPTVALSLIRQLYWESENNSFEEQLDLEVVRV